MEAIPMTDNEERSGAQKAFGDFAPAFVELTDNVLFGRVWNRPQLSPKERSLVTVSCLIAGGNTEPLTYHHASRSRIRTARRS
jgi:4-carboxymuconolactone decarboxylase